MSTWSERLGRLVAVTAAAVIVLAPSAQAAILFNTVGITDRDHQGNSQINGGWSFPAERFPAGAPGAVVLPAPDTTDDVPLRLPDLTGTIPNLAGLRGQTFTLRTDLKQAYTKLHLFGTTADGSGGGNFTLNFSDGTTQVANISFPDWCQAGNATAHVAIGRYNRHVRTGGDDGASCGIFHAPVTIAAGNTAKTLVSVTMPPANLPSPRVAYLMAMTLEKADGAFEALDLTTRDQFPTDNAAPTTKSAVSSAAPVSAGGWYKGPVQVTLTSEDEQPGGAGVEQITYRIDGGTITNYTAPFTVTSEGNHTVEYRAVDGIGNTESFKSVPVRIDATAPTTLPLPAPGQQPNADGWYDTAVDLYFSGGDGPGSGISRTEYRYAGQEKWTPVDGHVSVADGDQTVEFRSVDVADNVEAVKSVQLKSDGTAPVTTLTLNGAAPAASYVGAARAILTRTDGDGSGATRTEYRLDDGAWTPYTGQFDVTRAGSHRLDYRSYDALGNVENFRSHAFTVIAPTPLANVFQAPSTPRAPAFVALESIASRLSTRAALRRGKLAVRVTCQNVERGTLSLTVTRSVAKRLKLRSKTLAKRSVACGDQGRATVRLAPGAKVKRALAKYKRSVPAKLTIRMPGQASDSLELTLR